MSTRQLPPPGVPAPRPRTPTRTSWPPAPERFAILTLESATGTARVQVVVIGETPKRYRIRIQRDLSGYNWRGPVGTVCLVPKHLVTLIDEKEAKP